jgi:hypothetical protein
LLTTLTLDLAFRDDEDAEREVAGMIAEYWKVLREGQSRRVAGAQGLRVFVER